MRRLIRSRLIWISTICKGMSEFTWCPKLPALTLDVFFHFKMSNVPAYRNLIVWILHEKNHWTSIQYDVHVWMCIQRRFKSACAFTQSEHNFSFPLEKNVRLLSIHRAPIEDYDQTARMRRLNLVYNARTYHLVPFVGHRQDLKVLKEIQWNQPMRAWDGPQTKCNKKKHSLPENIEL